MDKLDTEKLKRAAEKLRPLLPKVRNQEGMASDERLFERFRPVFSRQNLSNLTEKDFRDFTLFSENEHWTGIHRHNGKILADIETLKKVLLEVTDESKPIDQRIDFFRPRGKGKLVNGLGSSIYTAVLFVLYPEKYPVLNTKTRRSLRALGIYPVRSSDSHGTRYKKVIEVSLALAEAVGCSLPELDGLHHHYLESVGKDDLPSLFKLSPGKQGEAWQEQRKRNVAAIGWCGSGDLSKEPDLSVAAKRSSEKIEGEDVSYIAGQYELIRDEIEEGDLVLYYAKGRVLGVGVVIGDYEFDASNKHGHTRPVRFVEPFSPVDITQDQALKDFFYHNNTMRAVEDDALVDKILRLIKETNPGFDWKDARGKDGRTSSSPETPAFKGIQKEAFDLLKKYEANPVKATWQATKADCDRLLKEPLRALMNDIADVVENVLGDQIETRAYITSAIHKNDYGKGGIHSHYWAAFYPTGKKRISSPQLFVILRPNEMRFGFGFGLYSKEFAQTFKERFKSASFWNASYLERLKNLGVVLRVNKSGEIGDSYDGPFDESVLIKALDSSDEQPNFDVAISPDEVEKMGAELSAKVREIFHAVLPLYVIAACETPDFFVKKWESEIDASAEDTEENAFPIEDKYSWSNFISDLNWSEGSFEAQQILNVLGSRAANNIYQGKQLIFYGPPGTGKTRAAIQLANHLATTRKAHLKVVQFHQSYGYEQFIEGIKPKASNGQLTYETREGVFVEFCRKAELRPNEQFVFVVDEINRGNVSRIFGELMYLLEYREQKLPLLYSQTPFSIPKNVVIVGTMNSADRSIALVDYALRRRFRFIEIRPQTEVLRRIFQERKDSDKELAIRFLERLNAKIRDPRLHIGHSYFLTEECLSEGLTKNVVKRIWDSALFPLLQEYFLAAPNRLEDFDFETLWGEPDEPARAA